MIRVKHAPKHVKLAVLILTAILFVLPAKNLSAKHETYSDNVKSVLILHSYYPSYIWTSQQTKTFVKAFHKMKHPEVELFVEYLDAQRSHSPQYLATLVQLFRQKYNNRCEFDLILCCDNAALNFINAEGKNLFAQSPVVFCGINNYSPKMLRSSRPTTGTEEKIEPAKTLEIALKLQPKTKKVFVISGHSRLTSRTTLQQTLKAFEPFSNKIEIEYSKETTMPALLEKVQSLSKDTIVFMLLFSKDKNGRKFSLHQAIETIADHCPVPIYGVWEFYLGHGLTGGKLTSAKHEAKLAAKLVEKVLHGEPAASIPVNTRPHNQYMFDWNYLKKFNLSTKLLPPESVIINKPVSFYSRNKTWIWTGIIGITLQSVLLLAFLINLIRRKKAEKNILLYKFAMDNSRLGIVVFDNNNDLIYINNSLRSIYPKEQSTKNETLDDLLKKIDAPNKKEFTKKLQSGQDIQQEASITTAKGTMPIEITAYSLHITHSTFQCFFIKNISSRKDAQAEQLRLENELHQSQKLESIGTLAAGIAHEINTPIQFIGDNTRFLSECIQDMLKLIAAYEKNIPKKMLSETVKQELHKIEEQVDLEFLKQELPEAIVQTMEGIDRVTNIVRAMKDFSHIGTDTMAKENINKAIESTIIISRNEWKYSSELQAELDPKIPLVECVIGDIKQVILNLIVNAAHAVADTKDQKNTSDKGLIKVTTCADKDNVTITVSDSGTGIPEEIRHKIFDPFFTTKKIGKGTGQGLSIAYSAIAEKHKGKIFFQSQTGKGTTFIIKLPIQQNQ